MTDIKKQLSLNFDVAHSRPQHNEDPAPFGEETYILRRSVVQLQNVREQRERTKRIEEERVLMERIRARVAHLQA